MSFVRHQDPTVAGKVSKREVRAQLDRILQSQTFKNSERLQRFLKYAVECALDGATDQLKESVLGRVVFDRGSEFDPRTDSIVRVEAQRLRRRLQEYYENDGTADPVAIQFEPGSYVPILAHTSEPPIRTTAKPISPRRTNSSPVRPRGPRRSGTSARMASQFGPG